MSRVFSRSQRPSDSKESPAAAAVARAGVLVMVAVMGSLMATAVAAAVNPLPPPHGNASNECSRGIADDDDGHNDYQV